VKLISDETGERYTVSELAARAGLSTASIKFYLRQGLLRTGDPRAEKKAYYDQGHLRRLVLIRSLRELAELSVEQVKKLTQTLDRGRGKTFELVAAAVDALATPRLPRTAQATRALATVRAQVHHKLELRGLTVRKGSATLDSLAQALLGLRAFQPALDIDVLDPYLDHIVPLAQAEFAANEARMVSSLAGPRANFDASPESALIGALVGTVLFEPLIVALRRIAHEHFAKELELRERTSKRAASPANQEAARRLPPRGRT
jgi:DNA-binding transcriptional MerR regulator